MLVCWLFPSSLSAVGCCFGIRCGCVLCVEYVRRCLLFADGCVLVVVVARCVLRLFVVVCYLMFIMGCCVYGFVAFSVLFAARRSLFAVCRVLTVFVGCWLLYLFDGRCLLSVGCCFVFFY